MTHFLSLPPEIRTLIYEYCLVVGKVYPLFSQLSFETYGYNQDLLNYELPDMALLTVSKQINLEAEKILYSRNTFVMPVLDDMERLYERYLQTPRRDALLWIRSVEVAFHAHDLSKDMRDDVLYLEYSDLAREVLSMRRLTQDDLVSWSSGMHDALYVALGDDAWYEKAKLVTTKLKLHRLTVVIHRLWCVYSCCWMGHQFVGNLAEGFVHGLPDHIEIVGLEESETETQIIDHIVHGHRRYQNGTAADSEDASCDGETDAEEVETG